MKEILKGVNSAVDILILFLLPNKTVSQRNLEPHGLRKILQKKRRVSNIDQHLSTVGGHTVKIVKLFSLCAGKGKH